MEDDGFSSVPSAPKQRQLLALLLLNAGRVVSADTCIEELWDEEPPDSARSTLQTYVLHLRHTISRLPGVGSLQAARKRLVTRNGGYQLVVYPGELDLGDFQQRERAGRRALQVGEDVHAARILHEALGAWRGPALVDVPVGPLLRTHVAGLEERRLNVLEQRIEVDLRLGRHHELLSELSELVERYPMYENIHAQFMLALYRSGRSARALQIFRELRGLLSHEVGIEPSPRLRRLHEAILAEDPSLEITAHTASRLSLDLLPRMRRLHPAT